MKSDKTKVLLLAVFIFILSVAYPEFVAASDISVSQATLALDAGVSRQVTVTSDGNDTITMQSYGFPNGITIDFLPSSMNFTGNNTQTLAVNATASNYITAGNYSGIILVGNIIVPASLKVFERRTWTVEPGNATETMLPGYVVFNNLRITNSGNSLLNITLTSTNDGMLRYPPAVSVLAGGYTDLFYAMSAPNGTTPRNYIVNLTLLSNSAPEKYAVMLNITVEDRNAPTLEIYKPDYVFVGSNAKFSAKATDDTNISRVKFFTDMDSFVYPINNSGMYYFNYTISDPKPYFFKIIAFDTFDNRIEREFNITGVKYENITVYNSVQLGTKRVNETTSGIIFTSQVPGKFSVKLKSISISDVNASFVLKLIPPGTSVRTLKVAGQIAEYDAAEGSTFIEMRSDKEITYGGELEITGPPEQKITNGIITFGGEFKKYSVTPSIKDSIMGHERSCDAQIENTYEKSSYACTTKYPVDTNVTDLGLSVSIAEYQQKCTDPINFYKNEAGVRLAERNGAYMFTVLAAIGIIFAVKIIPNIRLRSLG